MKTPEELLTRVINLLAEKYKNELILKCGMLLRLLNSPRETRDIDYCWVRTKKRMELGADLKKTLEELDGVKVVHMRANSRGLFLDVVDEPSGQKVQLEISVVKKTHLPPKPMTTAALATRYAQKAQIIAAMDPREAFSHKIAAALERNLIRDLYDMAQMEPITSFDPATLQDRLFQLEIGRTKPRKITPQEAAALLQKKIDQPTQKKIESEISGVVPPEQLPGLDLVIRASVSRVIRKLEAWAY